MGIQYRKPTNPPSKAATIPFSVVNRAVKIPIRAVVTDIEGTTTAIDFVHKILFPYSRTRITAWLAEHYTDTELQSYCKQHNISQNISITDLAHQLIEWIDQDLKHPLLKYIQGKIWREGYETGAYQSHFYEDVFPALTQWQAAGLTLCVYSSGSVEAQQLLFQYTPWGDKRNLFSHFFDTAVGAKKEAQSYHNIQQALALPPTQIVFLSDIAAELQAAQSAGWHTVLLMRPGNTPDPTFLQIETFDQLGQYFVLS